MSIYIFSLSDGSTASDALTVRSIDEDGDIKETVLRARTVYDKAYSTLKSQGTYIILLTAFWNNISSLSPGVSSRN